MPWDSLAPHPRGGFQTAGAQHFPSPEPSSPAPEHSGHFHLLSPLLPPAPVSSRHPSPSHSTLAALKPCAQEHLDQCALHIPGVLRRVPTWPGVDCPGFYCKLGVRPILTHKCYCWDAPGGSLQLGKYRICPWSPCSWRGTHSWGLETGCGWGGSLQLGDRAWRFPRSFPQLGAWSQLLGEASSWG